MNEKLNLSENGLVLLKGLEGFSSKIYADIKGWSVGYGHLIKENESHLMKGVTLELGEQLLINDVIGAENLIKKRVHKYLTQHEFDACVIMAYNVPIAFTTGSIDDKINANSSELEKTWKSYNKVRKGTKLTVNKHLVERRNKEWNLYISTL